VIDGVYASDEERRVRFHVLPAPDDAEVARVTARVARRVVRLLERRGLGPHGDPDEADPLRRAQPGLAELYGASVHGRIADGPRAGHRVTTLGEPIDVETSAVTAGSLCASVSGFSLHANVCIPARARRQLEKLCRYAARPPVATERLSLLPDGRLLYLLKHRWRDGTTHVVFEPLELVGKLAALVPPPRFNLVRYHGILAPAARWRRDIVPKSSVVEAGDCPPHSGCAARSAKRKPPEGQGQQEPHIPSRPRNYSWAELMRRVWAVDVLECPRCFGRMRIVAAIHSAEATRRILQYLGLPSRAPPIACASPDSDSDEQVIF